MGLDAQLVFRQHKLCEKSCFPGQTRVPLRNLGAEFRDSLSTDGEWIETHSMLADALTQKMRSDQLTMLLMVSGFVEIDRKQASTKATRTVVYVSNRPWMRK